LWTSNLGLRFSSVGRQTERVSLVELFVEENSVDKSDITHVRVARNRAADDGPSAPKTSRRRHVTDERLLEETAHSAVDADPDAYLRQIADPASTSELRPQDDVAVVQSGVVVTSRVQRWTEVDVTDDHRTRWSVCLILGFLLGLERSLKIIKNC